MSRGDEAGDQAGGGQGQPSSGKKAEDELAHTRYFLYWWAMRDLFGRSPAVRIGAPGRRNNASAARTWARQNNTLHRLSEGPSPIEKRKTTKQTGRPRW